MSSSVAPEHGPLSGPETAQLDREHDAEDERDQRHGRRAERDEALRGGQVIHGG